jgi:sugar lactone lactonase YvrE
MDASMDWHVVAEHRRPSHVFGRVHWSRGMAAIACVVEAQDALGESCIWCPVTRRVWWLDILAPRLQSFDPKTGEHRVYALPGRNCGNASLRKSGGFVLAMDNGLHSFDPDTGQTTFLVHPEPDQPDNRYNDGRCDRLGRLWIGTMMAAEDRHATGSLYRIAPDLSARREFDAITVPNSIAFSPDDRTFYFADTPKHIIWAFDFDLATGEISNRRVFADLSARRGLPDGSSVDAEGFLWNAEYAGHRVTRYAPDGRVDRSVDVPVTSPTCCCFGGDNLDTLYVTSASANLSPQQRAAEPCAGGLLAIDTGVRGLPEHAFGG